MRVAQRADLVVVALHAFVLALDDQRDLARQILLDRRAVARERCVLAALALLERRQVTVAGERPLEIDPAAMQGAGRAAAGLGLLRRAGRLRPAARPRALRQGSARSRRRMRSGGDFTCSAQVRKPYSPSLEVSISLLRMSMTCSLSIVCLSAGEWVICPSGSPHARRGHNAVPSVLGERSSR